MYDKTSFESEHDIAMIYLRERAIYNNFVLPSCLASLTEEVTAYRECHAAGWGATSEGGTYGKLDDLLQLLTTPPCQSRSGIHLIVTKLNTTNI